MIRYCSLLQMDSNYQGDLTDIFIGAGGRANHHVNPSRDHDHDDHHHQNQLESQVNINSEWQLLYPSDPMNCGDNFGDPFSTMRDPLFHHEGYDNNLPEVSASSIVITGQAHDRDHATTSTTNNNNNLLSHTTRAVNLHHDDQDEDQLKRPCNIFSRMLQISPSSTSKLAVSPCGSSSILVNSPGPVKSCANIVPTGNHVIISANTSNKGNCLVDNTGLQIFSPRNPVIKRRKSQAKKVICIPAPAAASSRQTGEVVPSDLWAWRKYGQKPIKGSPYPRGYYRCSSSKGCSARKQVERSRTDPNMLVITYTSEHNHPWPTQRNALAGSTRLQPLKNRSASKSYSLGSHHHQKTAPNDDQEQKDNYHSDNNASNTNKSVKEEIDDMEKQLEKDDQLGEYITEKLPYGSNLHSDQDFFAELGEIEADPLKLLFTQGFSGNEQKDSKALDPFSLFDWAGDDNANANITPFDGLK